ncbi:hypothetical protein JBL43_03180 [Aureibaculum sp. A20]|uniref:DUF5017 domain-containing protein n=1 Tax=Aureibaculum flavum TaxID=2795986 RepID=A0ABS0WML9_9FLAO|nr:hypothetical protein [Aureibaculum flavum]MBJ2173222.1 hypothetical protein [Aureibaculum flavum]
MKNLINCHNIIVRQTVFSVLVIMGFLFQSCDTEIPPTDTDPPTFSFTITGDGFDHTFTQDDDFENFELYVKSNTNYHFVFAAADAGGLRTMEWDIEPEKLFELITPVEDPWQILPNVFGDTMWIRWTDTTTADVKTGQFLTGDFRFPMSAENNASNTLDFWFHAGDFGGQSGPSNTVNKRLKIVITNQDTGVVYKLI